LPDTRMIDNRDAMEKKYRGRQIVVLGLWRAPMMGILGLCPNYWGPWPLPPIASPWIIFWRRVVC